MKISVNLAEPDLVKQVRLLHQQDGKAKPPFHKVEERKGTGKATCRSCGEPIAEGDTTIYYEHGDNESKPWLRTRGTIHAEDCGDFSKDWVKCPKCPNNKQIPQEQWSKHWREHRYEKAAKKLAHCGLCEEDQTIEGPRLTPAQPMGIDVPVGPKKVLKGLDKWENVLENVTDKVTWVYDPKDKAINFPVQKKKPLQPEVSEGNPFVSHTEDGEHVHDPFSEENAPENYTDYEGKTGSQACDYGHFTSDARRLPTGGNSGVWVCKDHYAEEAQYRNERHQENPGADWSIEPWDELEKQENEEPYIPSLEEHDAWQNSGAKNKPCSDSLVDTSKPWPGRYHGEPHDHPGDPGCTEIHGSHCHVGSGVIPFEKAVLRGTPSYGAVWHCPAHAGCPDEGPVIPQQRKAHQGDDGGNHHWDELSKELSEDEGVKGAEKAHDTVSRGLEQNKVVPWPKTDDEWREHMRTDHMMEDEADRHDPTSLRVVHGSDHEDYSYGHEHPQNPEAFFSTVHASNGLDPNTKPGNSTSLGEEEDDTGNAFKPRVDQAGQNARDKAMKVQVDDQARKLQKGIKTLDQFSGWKKADTALSVERRKLWKNIIPETWTELAVAAGMEKQATRKREWWDVSDRPFEPCTRCMGSGDAQTKDEPVCGACGGEGLQRTIAYQPHIRGAGPYEDNLGKLHSGLTEWAGFQGPSSGSWQYRSQRSGDRREEFDDALTRYKGNNYIIGIARNTGLHEDATHYHVRFHNTDILSYNKDKPELTMNVQGWDTLSSKERINRFLPNNFHVESGSISPQNKPDKAHEFPWILTTPKGHFEFENGMTVNTETGEAGTNELQQCERCNAFRDDEEMVKHKKRHEQYDAAVERNPYKKCTPCGGTGTTNPFPVQCKSCKGKGKRLFSVHDGIEDCTQCAGTGITMHRGAWGDGEGNCFNCKGEGKVRKTWR